MDQSWEMSRTHDEAIELTMAKLKGKDETTEFKILKIPKLLNVVRFTRMSHSQKRQIPRSRVGRRKGNFRKILLCYF